MDVSVDTCILKNSNKIKMRISLALLLIVDTQNWLLVSFLDNKHFQMTCFAKKKIDRFDAYANVNLIKIPY